MPTACLFRLTLLDESQDICMGRRRLASRLRVAPRPFGIQPERAPADRGLERAPHQRVVLGRAIGEQQKLNACVDLLLHPSLRFRTRLLAALDKAPLANQALVGNIEMS